MTTSSTSDTGVASRARVRVGVPAAAVVFVVYSVIFIGLWKQSGVEYAQALDSADSTLQGPVRSLVAGSIWLVVFLLWARWDHVFTDWRRLRMGFWLWLPAGLMVVAFAMQFAGVSWGEFTGAHVMWVVVAGVLVGFAEETLFRGIILRALREGGRREGVVVLVSSLWFGLFHLTNLITGSSVTSVIQQVVVASLAGIALYLWRRGTGLLVAGMMIHGLWDMSSFLLGVHKVDGSPWPLLGSAVGSVVYLSALVALIIIWRRRDVAAVDPTSSAPATS
jgi:membrane protease YdiL (CAAX protease family)